jgi:RNAse (barnase) inhibitor barstar
MMSVARFIFTDDQDRPELRGSFKGFVGPGIFDADKLLDEVAKSLNFPAYFGENWNALFDCLRDFNWIEEERICLIHKEVPSIEIEDLKVYLEILRDAVNDWKDGEDHEFFVLFPASSEGRVRSLLQ